MVSPTPKFSNGKFKSNSTLNGVINKDNVRETLLPRVKIIKGTP